MNNLYEKVTLAGIYENIQSVPSFFRDAFFSDEEVFLTSKVQFDVVKGGIKVAPYVNPRVGGVVLEEAGFLTKEYEPPLVAPQKVLTAEDLKYRQPGETIYFGSSYGKRALKKVVEDYIYLNKSIDLREELMCAEVITTGKIPVKGKGVDQIITLGEITKKALTGVDRWGEAGAKIVDDIFDLKKTTAKSGHTPNIMITSDKVARMILADEDVRKWFNTINYNNGVIKPEVLEAGGVYYGYIPPLGMHLYSYEAEYADYDNINPEYPTIKTTDAEFKPAFKRYVPENLVIMSYKGIGKMLYGAIVDIQLGDTTLGKKRVPKSWDKESPSAKIVEVKSRPLAVVHNLDAVGLLEVF